MPGLAGVVPTLVVAGTVGVALPAAVVATVLGAVVVVLGAVVGDALVVLGAVVALGAVVVAGAALEVLTAGTRSCPCSCSRPP